jgi:hypothetical protein
MVRTCCRGCEDFDWVDEARLVGNLARHKQAFGDQCAEISIAISKARSPGLESACWDLSPETRAVLAVW